MYVALRQLTARDLKPIMPGDIVGEAASWSYSVLKAHIDNEWIKEVPDEEQPKVKRKAKNPRRRK